MKKNSPLVSLPLLRLLLALNLATVSDAAAASHLVRKGDTISGIAKTHGCSPDALRAANKLKGDIIKIGQKLTLPDNASAAKPSKPKKAGSAKTKPGAETSAAKDNTTASPAPGTPAKPATKEDPAPAEKNTAPSAPASAALSAMLGGLSGEDRWRVQIFLDLREFAPGKVDGLPGVFTEKAAARWLKTNPSATPATLLAEARAAVSEVEARVGIPKIAAEYVGEVPSGLKAQAKAKTLPYRSLAEFMAERFHTDESALARLNPGRDLGKLRIGQTLIVPAVTPFRIENRSSTFQNTGAAAGISLRILHTENMLEVVRADGGLAAAYPITVGRKKEHIRAGVWKIEYRAIDPKFTYDPRMLAEGKSGPVRHLLPPGPNSPVGILWMELEPVRGPEAHIGIHGTDSSSRIGRNQSSGCIRLANWDIVRLARHTRAGTRVVWGPAGNATGPDATAGLVAAKEG